MVLYVTLAKGTMFGGKTSDLERRYRQYKVMSRTKTLRILALKPCLDTRYSTDHIVTHDGKKFPCIQMKKLLDIDVDKWDVIFIDEAQFFPDLYEFIEKNFQKKCRVHIAGLNGDKNQKNFGDVNRISPFCSEETVHHGMCQICGDSAPFTREYGETSELIAPGGEEKYYTVCYKHLYTIPTHPLE